MNEEWSWNCIRCEREVACAFCECCEEHCTSLRPNALKAHRRQGTVVVASMYQRETLDHAPSASVKYAPSLDA